MRRKFNGYSVTSVGGVCDTSVATKPHFSLTACRFKVKHLGEWPKCRLFHARLRSSVSHWLLSSLSGSSRLFPTKARGRHRGLSMSLRPLPFAPAMRRAARSCPARSSTCSTSFRNAPNRAAANAAATCNGPTNRARWKPYAGLSPSPVSMATAANAVADFSPAEEHFPLPQNRRSPRLERALAEMGSDAEFRDGVAPLETLGISVSHKTIQRVSEAVGSAVAEAQHGALACVQAPEKAPVNPPDLLVIEA